MVNDPLGDALIQIKNGYLAGKETVTVPFSKIKEELVKLLAKTSFISSYETYGNDPKRTLLIKLKYIDKKPVLTNVVRLSKPGLRIYVNKDNIPNVLGGLGITIISTPKGLTTGNLARKKKIGGEVICKIW